MTAIKLPPYKEPASKEEYEARCVTEQNRYGRERPRIISFTGGMPTRYCALSIIVPVLMILISVIMEWI